MSHLNFDIIKLYTFKNKFSTFKKKRKLDSLLHKKIGRCGGIGRRGGFKIHCSQGRAGSIPVIGTGQETHYSSGFLVIYYFTLKRH